MKPAVQVWVINQYALRPGQAGGTRHATLAEGLLDHGMETLIVHASATRADAPRHTPREVVTHRGVRYLALPTPSYSTNGLPRLYSTLKFCGEVCGMALYSRRRFGEPAVVLGSSPDLLSALAAWALSKLLQTPFVWEVRDIWPASLIELAGLSEHHPFVKLLASIERFLCRRSDAIVGLLKGTKDRVAEASGPTEAAKVIWIPNGTTTIDRANEVVNAEAIFSLVYFGAHGIPNSLDTLVDVAFELESRNHCSGNYPRFEFHLYGSGIMKRSIIQRVADLNVRSIHFHDPVPKYQVQEILQTSHIAVLPGLKTNLYRYGASPNKLYDYLAAGVPVVTGLNMLENPVEIANAGIVVVPQDPIAFADALVRLAEMSTDDRQALGRNGRQYVEMHHNPRLLAARLHDVIRSVYEKR